MSISVLKNSIIIRCTFVFTFKNNQRRQFKVQTKFYRFCHTLKKLFQS